VSGNLTVASNTALGTGTFTVAGADHTLRLANSPTIGNAVQLDQTLNLVGDLNDSTGTFAGPIGGSGGINFRPLAWTLRPTFTAANGFTGAVALGSNGLAWTSATLSGSGTMSAASGYTLARGTVLTLDN